jgi:hypothetical protein
MAKQRPSLEALMVAATSQRHDVTAELSLSPAVNGASERRRPSQPHTSIYLSKPVVRELKRIALEFDRKPHDVLIEAINLVLAKYGRPSIADLESR